MMNVITPSFSNGIIRIFFLAAFFLAMNSAAYAEAIFLNDGRTVYGRILNQGDTHMQVRTSYGIIALKKADIKRVDYDLGLGQVTVVLKNGDMVSGTLISLTATKVIVKDETIDHDIPRTEIENLVLSKFEGRRDNIFGIMGGMTKTVSSVKEQVPYAIEDFSAFFLRSYASMPYFQWGLSASYIRLITNTGRTRLDNPVMTLCPLLVDVRLKYPLFSFLFKSSWASKINFFAGCGAGASYVILAEGNENRTGSYLTIQPSLGVSVAIGERLYLVNQYDYAYIYQSTLPYAGVRARLGAGFIF